MLFPMPWKSALLAAVVPVSIVLAVLSPLGVGCATSTGPSRAPFALVPIPSTSGSTAPPADPAAVQAEVEKRLFAALRVINSVDVTVDKNGVALLTGFVATDEERDHAIRVASGTPGVTAVAQDIRVTDMSFR